MVRQCNNKELNWKHFDCHWKTNRTYFRAILKTNKQTNKNFKSLFGRMTSRPDAHCLISLWNYTARMLKHCKVVRWLRNTNKITTSTTITKTWTSRFKKKKNFQLLRLMPNEPKYSQCTCYQICFSQGFHEMPIYCTSLPCFGLLSLELLSKMPSKMCKVRVYTCIFE